jgi:adenylate cyclase
VNAVTRLPWGRPSRRQLRLASGLVLLFYMVVHMANHALGLLSLDAAERALEFWAAVWQSRPGTVLLYGATTLHVALAFVAIYEKPDHRLPVIELVRIAAGFSIPLLLVAHLASTRIAFELQQAAPTYSRVVGTIWAAHGEARQLALLAPGWLHGCLGIYIAFRHRRWFVRSRVLLLAAALALPILSGMGFLHMTTEVAARGVVPARVDTATSATAMRTTLFILYGLGFAGVFGARMARRRKKPA